MTDQAQSDSQDSTEDIRFPWGQAFAFSAAAGLVAFNVSIAGTWLDWWEELGGYVVLFVMVGFVAMVIWLLSMPLTWRLGRYGTVVPALFVATAMLWPQAATPPWSLSGMGIGRPYLLLCAIGIICGLLLGATTCPGIRPAGRRLSAAVLTIALFGQPLAAILASAVARDGAFDEVLRQELADSAARSGGHLDLAGLARFGWDQVSLYPTARSWDCLDQQAFADLAWWQREWLHSSIRSGRAVTLVFTKDGKIVRWFRSDPALFSTDPAAWRRESQAPDGLPRWCRVPYRPDGYQVVPSGPAGSLQIDIAHPDAL